MHIASLILFSLFLIALPTSIAGMEALGWLLSLSAVGEVMWRRFFRKEAIGLGLGGGPAAGTELGRASAAAADRVGAGALPSGTLAAGVLPDVAAWLLWLVAILGVAVNASAEADAVYIIGNFRWVILLYGYTYMFRGYGIGGRAARKLATEPLLFWRVLVPVLVVVSIYGIIQVFTGIDLIRPGREVHNLGLAGVHVYRASGFFNNPMTFAHLFVLWFCVQVAYLIVDRGPGSRRLWAALATLLVGLAILLSLIRGVWISGVVAFLSMLWLWRRKAFWWGVAGTVVAVGVMVATVPPLRDRLSSVFSTTNIHNRDRVALWEANWEIFKKYPLLGIGYTENERRIGEFYQQMGVENGFKGHAHNVYLQFLAGTGALGLLCYLLLVGAFLWMTVRAWRLIPEGNTWARALVLGIFGAQVSLHIGGLTQNNFSDGEVTHNLMVIFALASYWAGALRNKELKV